MALVRNLERIRFSKLPPLSQVPRIVDPPTDVFNRYFVDRGSPVISVGAAPFRDKPPTLADMLSGSGRDIGVQVRGGDYADVRKRENRRMPLVDYVEQYLSRADERESGTGENLPNYAGNSPLSKSDFDALGLKYPDRFDDGASFQDPRLWIGPKGSLTALHNDGSDNLMCQYVGRKYLKLFPPSQIKWLYTTGFGPSWSGIPDPRTPDLVKFPLFARARSVDVTLNPGEILYLPARWSHFVLNLEISVMVNFWHEPSKYNLLRSAMANFWHAPSKYNLLRARGRSLRWRVMRQIGW